MEHTGIGTISPEVVTINPFAIIVSLSGKRQSCLTMRAGSLRGARGVSRGFMRRETTALQTVHHRAGRSEAAR